MDYVNSSKRLLRVAAADILGALPVMKVSDRLTWRKQLLSQ